MPVKTIEWVNGKVRIIDQTLLPEKLVYLDIDDVVVLGEAIQKLRVRGAPAIGIAGAMGIVLAANGYLGDDKDIMIHSIRGAISYLRKTRPTAVNLFWALDRMEKALDSAVNRSMEVIRERLLQEALTILDETGRSVARWGRTGQIFSPRRLLS